MPSPNSPILRLGVLAPLPVEFVPDSPSALEESIIKNRDWGATKASMMRNGALSRMQELGLISREKQGREVTYSLTESGKSYFEL